LKHQEPFEIVSNGVFLRHADTAMELDGLRADEEGALADGRLGGMDQRAARGWVGVSER